MSFIRPVGTPTIDWSNPITTDLGAWWLPDGLNPVVDLTGNVPNLVPAPSATPAVSAGVPGSSSFGPGVLLSQTARQGYAYTGVCPINGLATATFFVVASGASGLLSQGCLLGCQSSANVSDRLILDLSVASDWLTPHALLGDATVGISKTATNSSPLAANTPTAICVTVDYGPAQTMSVFTSGVKTATTALTKSGVFNFDTVSLGCRASGDFAFTADSVAGSPNLANVSSRPFAAFNGNMFVSGANLAGGLDQIASTGTPLVMDHNAITTQNGASFVLRGHASFVGGVINAAGIAKRIWTDAEIAAWSANPTLFSNFPTTCPSFWFRK